MTILLCWETSCMDLLRGVRQPGEVGWEQAISHICLLSSLCYPATRLCATLNLIHGSTSQIHEYHVAQMHPSGVQSWAGESPRSPDPQTPPAALV